MRYISTRGGGSPVSFEDALLTGLAPDGGLFMPETWPQLPAGWLEARKDAPYAEFAAFVANAFAGDHDLTALAEDTYAGFDHEDVAPLRELEPGLYLLELFHGPTFAFKDFAMQMLGRLFNQELKARGERRTIVVATSGDTGAAAVEAFAGLEAVDLFVMHPKGKVSDAQRRQMTTCLAPNVHNLAVAGTFDDCQTMLKDLFADEAFRREIGLGAVNSINWARIVAQTAYYLSTVARLGEPTAFSVPTGNFGDIFAGFVAHKMGADLGPMVIATNANDILDRALKTGSYSIERAVPTLSPAMDIQISSNFERLLFETMGRDAKALSDQMNELRETGAMPIRDDAIARIRELFVSACVSDTETSDEIAKTYEATGVIVDPHTAVGLRAARQLLAKEKRPRVVLATAHPAKFEAAVEGAIGKAPELPKKLADAMSAEERCDDLAPDAEALKAYVRSHR